MVSDNNRNLTGFEPAQGGHYGIPLPTTIQDSTSATDDHNHSDHNPYGIYDFMRNHEPPPNGPYGIPTPSEDHTPLPSDTQVKINMDDSECDDLRENNHKNTTLGGHVVDEAF